MKKQCVSDLDDCRRLWNRFIAPKNISDLWDFRLCFQRHFGFKPCFHVFEDRAGVTAMLPLSYAEDLETFFFFPGEIWQNRTWIERTPFHLREREYLEEVLASCPERTYLRYMELEEGPIPQDLEMDEIGYVLYPPSLGFDLEHFRKKFHHKKVKNILRVIRNILENGGLFRVNRLRDFDLLVAMSLQQFGSGSYLYDYRFREGFRDLVYFLHARKWLRMVSLEIKGRPVAVDVGALFGDTYTLFLGATDPEFPGVAKVMNMHHIEFAFRERLAKIDFLCGDFHWKKLWHLDPEPLFKYVSPLLRHEEAIEYLLPYGGFQAANGDLTHA